MKKLWLLRHAKSDWDDPSLDDHDRFLAPRGERAARLMGGYLAEQADPPTCVLCSSSRRTRETLELLRPRLPGNLVVEIERPLYLASAEQLLGRVAQLDDGVGSALLIGHNPGIAQLAFALAAEEPGGIRTQIARKFPTAALATLQFETRHWSELGERRGRLGTFVTPKQLAAEAPSD